MERGGDDVARDPARLATLRDYAILDTPGEIGFDDIVRLAARACDAPTALVSMVADDRQWFKARSGFAEIETDLVASVCTHTVAHDDLLVIPDLMRDPRTAGNRLVTAAPHARFYAGAPLRVANGQVLGALCVIDHAARPGGLTDEQADTLRALAGQVVALLELRRALAAQTTREAYWRGLFENLTEGFVVKEAVRDEGGHVVDWRVVQANAAWCRMMGMGDAPVIGRTFSTLFPAIERGWTEDFTAVVETGDARTFRRAVGTLGRWFEGHAFRLGPDRFAATMVDVTVQVQAEARRKALERLGDRLRDLESVPSMTAEASRIVGETLGVTRAGYGHLDDPLEHVEIERGWTAPGHVDIAGRYAFADYGDLLDDLRRGEPLVIDDVTTDPRTAADPAPMHALSIGALINMPVRERGRMVAVFFVHDDRRRTWSKQEIAFLRSVADRVEVGVARLRADERQQLLNQELSHRLKNTLAIVQAVATQTLKGVSERAAVGALEQRLMALAAAHDVLLHKNWVGADLRRIAEDVIGAVVPLDRIAMRGDPVDLGARATLSLSLVLHELVTNATKYGALSMPTGQVTLDWRLEAGARGRDLVLTWIETGGPPAAEPTRRGFGSKLIRMGLIGTGGVDARYDESGFSVLMRAPLVELQQA